MRLGERRRFILSLVNFPSVNPISHVLLLLETRSHLVHWWIEVDFISLCSALLSRLRQEATAQQLLLFSDFPFTLVFVPERKRRQGNAASYRIVSMSPTHKLLRRPVVSTPSSRRVRKKNKNNEKKDTHNLGREINNNKNSRMAVAMEAGQDTGLWEISWSQTRQLSSFVSVWGRFSFTQQQQREQRTEKKKKKKRRRRLKTRDPCFSIAAPFFFYYPLRFLDVFVCVCGWHWGPCWWIELHARRTEEKEEKNLHLLVSFCALPPLYIPLHSILLSSTTAKAQKVFFLSSFLFIIACDASFCWLCLCSKS